MNLFGGALTTIRAIGKVDKMELEVEEERNARKDFGQFFTPKAVARLMAKMAAKSARGHVKILDPGSGEGILCGTLANELESNSAVDSIHVDAFEIERTLAEKTGQNLASL